MLVAPMLEAGDDKTGVFPNGHHVQLALGVGLRDLPSVSS